MVGIIGAMEEEVRELIEDMTECEMQERASMKFYKGMLYGKEAVVVQSGIGKVNAAICTQILADFYQVDQLINTGEPVLWMQRSISEILLYLQMQ